MLTHEINKFNNYHIGIAIKILFSFLFDQKKTNMLVKFIYQLISNLMGI